MVPLAEAREELQFGGKAVALGTACRAGLPVPKGVALSVALVEGLLAGEPAASSAFEGAVSALEGPFAVRSSAIGEDSADVSFAGQYTTKLNVMRGALREAVAAVWQSRRSRGALAYRRQLGIDEEPRMAVVVQELVDADVAGVLFTQNPVSGADERLIEATWSLGEAVVQGLVIPDLYRMSRTGEVLERVPGRKAIAIRARTEDSTIQETVAPSLIEALCLDDAQLASLHHLARRCERAFGGPCDLEWALAGGILYLVQRRPITRVAK